MSHERITIIHVEGYGYGLLRKAHSFYSEVDVSDGKHRWSIAVPNDEYEVVKDINIKREDKE